MIRSLAAVILILLFVHLLAAVGFVGWLGATDRLNGDRLKQVVHTFTPTIAEQNAAEAEAERMAEQAAETRDQLLRLQSVADGPQTVEQRLMENFEADEASVHRLERLQAETEAIRRRLDQDKQLIAEEAAELAARKEAFEEAMAQRTRAMEDEDFARAVKTLEQLPPKQAKAVLQQYLAEGRLEESVDYLASMQLRKSADILKSFKVGQEVAQAALLIEQLRTRGLDPLNDGA